MLNRDGCISHYSEITDADLKLLCEMNWAERHGVYCMANRRVPESQYLTRKRLLDCIEAMLVDEEAKLEVRRRY